MFVNSKRSLVFAASFICFVAATLSLFWAFWKSPEQIQQEREAQFNTTRLQLSEQLQNPLAQGLYPEQLYIQHGRSETLAFPTYTINDDLQAEADKILRAYKPDYGAIVMMDAETGRILALSSWHKKTPEPARNLALAGTFPAASIFKIITATAAMDKHDVEPDTIILFNGSNHTLYRRNVMNVKRNRWTREMSLREAFALSVNTAFGRLAFEHLDPSDLEEYAIRFGFNQNIVTDIPFQPGETEIPHEKSFALAELASGFNRITTLSPVQGAMIAASVVMDGEMRAPYLVERLVDQDNQILFQAEPITVGSTMTPEGAQRLRELMEATVRQGTSKKAFRPLTRNRRFKELEVGGKTGSLTGRNPQGRTDWFVGYAANENQKIAVAAVTVHKDYWTVRSSHLAQHMFQKHFKEAFTEKNRLFFAEGHE